MVENTEIVAMNRRPRSVTLKTKLLGVKKLIRIGNAMGVVLPKAVLEYAGWRRGDLLDVYYNDEREGFIITNLSNRDRRE